MEGNFLVRFKVETYMFVFCSDNQLNSYKSEAKWVYFWDQQFDYRALSRAMGCYILFPVYHLEMVSRLLFVFKKASPLTVVFIHQGYENSYILLELWTKFQASLSKNHPPVEVSLSRTPVLYPRDSCWHCFLTSHWIRAGHNWIPRGSMQCGEKKESQASWLHDCGKLITEACEGWRKASSDRSGWIFCHSNTVWSDKGSPKKGWKKYASWQKLSKSWFYLSINALRHRLVVCGHNWSV